MRKKLLWIGTWLGLIVAVVSFVLMITSIVLIAIEKPGNTVQKTVALKTELTQNLTGEGFRTVEVDEEKFQRVTKNTQNRSSKLLYTSFIYLADGFAPDKLINKTLVKTEVDENRFLQPKDVYWFAIGTYDGDGGYHLILHEDNYDNSPPPEMTDFDIIRFKGVTSEGIVLEYFAYPYFVWPGFYFYLGGAFGGLFFGTLCGSWLSGIRRNQKK